MPLVPTAAKIGGYEATWSGVFLYSDKRVNYVQSYNCTGGMDDNG